MTYPHVAILEVSSLVPVKDVAVEAMQQQHRWGAGLRGAVVLVMQLHPFDYDEFAVCVCQGARGQRVLERLRGRRKPGRHQFRDDWCQLLLGLSQGLTGPLTSDGDKVER